MNRRTITKIIAEKGKPVKVILDNGDVLCGLCKVDIESLPSSVDIGITSIKAIFTELEV